MPKKYRKKPVEIEAAHFKDQEKADEIAKWCEGWVETRQNKDSDQEGYALHKVIMIKTLEGDMRADPGDYIICGVKGEFYPCKPDIFEATYELVED